MRETRGIRTFWWISLLEYAASAVLSIFGSLGIVKASIAVLIACINIPKPWVSDHESKFKQSMVSGAKLLQNSGFVLPGNVAPLIGMDGMRFKAETKLIQILEEKHIDNPEKVSIKWKSRDWNVMLVLFTMIASAINRIPYYALLLGSASWRPTTHLPWLFPFLRTVGSCLASVLCQFIIQSRGTSLMKQRIMFMDIHRQLSDGLSKDHKDGLDNWIKEHSLQWDPNLPAEQCILNLERFLASSTASDTQTNNEFEKMGPHVSIEMENIATSSIPQKTLSSRPASPSLAHWVPPSPLSLSPPPPSPFSPSTSPLASPPLPAPPPLLNKDFKLEYSILQCLRHKHFPSPSSDRTTALVSWAVLLLSLPAAVAGYIGCFTLVGASSGGGPLVWLGLEAALSIFRIFIWAWNPSFDENTGITVELELTEHPPMVTTANHNAFIHDSNNKSANFLPLTGEREFLEWITPFTGPLDQFQIPVNIALYFTLTADYSAMKENFGRKYTSLLLSVFDFNTRVGVTLLKLKGLFYYLDADIKYDTMHSGMVAYLKLPMSDNHSWRMQESDLFTSLEDYYHRVMRALDRRVNKEGNTAVLDRRWNLSPKAMEDINSASSLSLLDLTNHNQLYLDRGYEHYLKIMLVEVWSRWIVQNMEHRASDARNDCYEALTDKTSEKARWELNELDRLVVVEWAKRELALLVMSIKLEEILLVKMQDLITAVCKERHDGRLEQRMRHDFDVGRLKRLDKERGEAKKRMEEAMKNWGERAEREGRTWQDRDWFSPDWQKGIDLVDRWWSEGIWRGLEELVYAESEIDRLPLPTTVASVFFPTDEEKWRSDFRKQVIRRFTHWRTQRESERREMEKALDHIRRVGGQREHMDDAYNYPEPELQAACKFGYIYLTRSIRRIITAVIF